MHLISSAEVAKFDQAVCHSVLLVQITAIICPKTKTFMVIFDQVKLISSKSIRKPTK